MNRLVIIGNGFDLAHGLPTSYRDFIDDFWRNFKDKCKTEEYKELIHTHDGFDKYYSEYKQPIENFDDIFSNIKNYWNDYPENHFDESSLIFYTRRNLTRDKIFEFKNDFFKRIVQKNSENWVDVENEYYNSLKKIVNESLVGNNFSDKQLEDFDKSKKIIVKKLNDEFEQIKNLLKKYLIDSIEKCYDFDDKDNNWAKFYEILKPISIYNNEVNLIEEFNDVKDRAEIKNLINFQKVNPDNLRKSTFCLNFNYTTTIYKYLESLKKGEIRIDNIHIHGELLNDKNQINFGFGDEMDEDYKAIENINDNEYLRNFKSFQYLQNNNYDKLLSYIDSEKYQVIILGHSCGLSDRTLLNTIFEHKNCRSIKPYYYEIKNETDKVIADNYTEIIQNISRHFNDKVKMRSKIVNKTLCKPLPQIQLPKNKTVSGLLILDN